MIQPPVSHRRVASVKAKIAGSEPTDPTVSVAVQGVKNTRKVLGYQPV